MINAAIVEFRLFSSNCDIFSFSLDFCFLKVYNVCHT
nr:MAG TPA: hypothetical protein [Caudoviricetes sp.]